MGGFFSLNPEYQSLCVVENPKDDIAKRFKKIRTLAIQCLKQIEVERLDLISLQLVQALRYEDIQENGMSESPLKDYLLDTAVENE